MYGVVWTSLALGVLGRHGPTSLSERAAKLKSLLWETRFGPRAARDIPESCTDLADLWKPDVCGVLVGSEGCKMAEDVTDVILENCALSCCIADVRLELGTTTPMPPTTTLDPPTSSPSGNPTSSPTDSPTSSPSGKPTSSPTDSPTSSPSGKPTTSPTDTPTSSPSPPTESPTYHPTAESTTEEPAPAPGCCKALTLECLICATGATEEEICATYPDLEDCEELPCPPGTGGPKCKPCPGGKCGPKPPKPCPHGKHGPDCDKPCPPHDPACKDGPKPPKPCHGPDCGDKPKPPKPCHGPDCDDKPKPPGPHDSSEGGHDHDHPHPGPDHGHDHEHKPGHPHDHGKNPMGPPKTFGDIDSLRQALSRKAGREVLARFVRELKLEVQEAELEEEVFGRF